MPTAATTLRTAAHLLNHFGLHTGEHFATNGGGLSVAAAIYRAATYSTPNTFLTDPAAAIALIHDNAPAMNAIRVLSAVLDTHPPTDIDTDEPDHIEHISYWAATPAIGETNPPTISEILGRILRAADAADFLDSHRPALRPAA
jgi:hypothetical protein